MRGELIALDLETTGLDPSIDSIIEFGAVLMRDGLIVSEYSTLINPGRTIPSEVSALTGITDQDILQANAGTPAPSLVQALPELRAFVGERPIIGHNIGFDLEFLRRTGHFKNNFSIDTLDLAVVLLPRSPRYNLASLALQLKLELEDHHRALSDARAAALLYQALWQRGLNLPTHILREILNAGQDLPWNPLIFFEHALDQQLAAHPQNELHTSPMMWPASNPSPTITPTESDEPPSKEPRPIWDALSQIVPRYEERPEQIEMTQIVSTALENGEQLMLEAGTGIGKTLAYLSAAVEWSQKHRQRVVISTNTIQLQEQILNQELPRLGQALNQPIQAAVLKGRSNYLCPRRLMDLRRRRPTNPEELRVLTKILIWLAEGGSGDKAEINLRGSAEHAIWQRLSAEHNRCSTTQCSEASHATCPFHQTRKAADHAQLIIVNHALLMADDDPKDSIIPEHHALILDEAHHLEEAATHSNQYRWDQAALQRYLVDIGGTQRGILADCLVAAKPQMSAKEYKRLEDFVVDISSVSTALSNHIKSLFAALSRLFQRTETEGNNALRLTPALRKQDAFAETLRQSNLVKEFLLGLQSALQQVQKAIHRYTTQDDTSDLRHNLSTIIFHLQQAHTQLSEVLDQDNPKRISWINPGYDYQPSLTSVPAHAGSLLESKLWKSDKSIILVSSTLRDGDSFNHLTHRLQAQHMRQVVLGSPFDYRTSTLIFIPNDMPDPNERGKYQQSVERCLIELPTALNGRTLGLFTSYTQLQQTAQAIRPRLALGEIIVYDQVEASNRQLLVDGFKSTEKAVLLGTRSFWEGVDIPGDSISAVVITRLPFPVPNDPVFAARAETYQDAFQDYTIPEAIIRFRQGFGRLIRSKQDRGVIVILDRRLMSKSYGKQFLDALPDCTIQYGSLQSLPEIAQKWVEPRSSNTQEMEKG
jgi:DNA polymerase-3 subunit epsilon/ATP-dependent DNA helicase DinG